MPNTLDQLGGRFLMCMEIHGRIFALAFGEIRQLLISLVARYIADDTV